MFFIFFLYLDIIIDKLRKLKYLLLILFSVKLLAFDPTGQTLINTSEKSFLPSLQNRSGFGFFYAPGYFGIDELSQLRLTWYDDIFIPSSISISAYSNEIYNNFVFNSNVGYNFENTYQLGGGISYEQFVIKGFDTDTKFSFDLGGIVNVGNSLTAGFHYHNILGNTFSDSLTDPTQVLNLSMAWQPESKFALSIGTTVWIPGRSWFFATARYSIFQDMQAFIKVYGIDSRVNFGVSFSITDFLFNPEMEYHSRLGFSQSYLIEFYY